MSEDNVLWRNQEVEQDENCYLSNLYDYLAKHKIMQILKSATSALLEERPEKNWHKSLAKYIKEIKDKEDQNEDKQID